MNTELKVVMFTDQVESTSNMAKRTHSETLQVTTEQEKLTKGAALQCRYSIAPDALDATIPKEKGGSSSTTF